MDIKIALESLKSIVVNMPQESWGARMQSLDRIKSIVHELKSYAEEHDQWNGYMSEKFHSLMWSAEAIAGLNDGNGHTSDQHASWANIAINSLKSIHCFGLN